MIYLDNAATTLQKPACVAEAMLRALRRCANPGRGGHLAARLAEREVYRARRLAGELFDLPPEKVCFTLNATHALNIAIRTLVPPGGRAILSGLEHNAVTRTLAALGADMTVVHAPLFDPERWLAGFDDALKKGADAAICLHVSNVFGAILPVERLAVLCRERRVPLIVDASQSAGVLPLRMQSLGAAFAAMPGHKGLLGPQGTGLLLCGVQPKPLLTGGTGSQSLLQTMPELLPDAAEAGTLNVPGVCGLAAALEHLKTRGTDRAFLHEKQLTRRLCQGLQELGARVFCGEEQIGVVSFLLPGKDVEQAAADYDEAGVALRAGLHCAPFAHQTAGTLPEGTLRVSVSAMTRTEEIEAFLRLTKRIHPIK